MKIIHSSIVTVLAVFTLAILNTTQAQPGRFGRLRSSENADLADSKISGSPRQDSATAASQNAPAANRGRYRVIDLGTLGGPDSSNVFPARNINNRGQLIALSATAVPDPECFQEDCYVTHAILREPNGSIIELPFPPGIDATNNNSLAGDLTQNGLMGGFVENGLIDPLTDFPQLRAVVWGRYGSSATDLGTFGGNSSQVDQVNSRGFAVGAALNSVPENPDFASFMNFFIPAATRARAFVWQGGALEDLGTLGGHDACAAAINNSGLIFGMSYVNPTPNDTTGLPTVHPFLWSNGQMQDLGSLGGTLSVAGGLNVGPFGAILNNRGQAIGTSTLPGDETWHAFLWNSGTMIDLGTLGGNVSEALAINESGLIVGRSDFSPDSAYHHATLWRNGTIMDLGVAGSCQNSTATAVNSAGDVVGGLGACTDNSGSAFMWKRGNPMVDLNDLVSPPSDMHIEFASGINDRGEIVGSAFLPTGEVRAVLLVPIPGR